MKQHFGHSHDDTDRIDQVLKYTCPKCGGKTYKVGEIWAFGSFWTKLLQLHTRRFTFINCENCKYTELYKVPKSELGNVINFMAK